MKKFFVGVKAVIREERGILLIKHASGFWDMPGGRLDDDETLEEGLTREISEELPGSKLKSIKNQISTYRVHKDIVDDVSLVLVLFDVDVELAEKVVFSDEHTEYRWIQRPEDKPEPIDPNMWKIVSNSLKW